MASPAAFAVTKPELPTEATEELLEDHVTVPVAPAGCNVALSWSVLPVFKLAVFLFKVMPVGSIGSPPPLAG